MCADDHALACRRPAVMIIESAGAPNSQLILKDRLSTYRAGEPPGRVGEPPGRVGEPPGRVGEPPGRVGEPPGRVGVGSATEVAARHTPPVGLVTPNNVTVTQCGWCTAASTGCRRLGLLGSGHADPSCCRGRADRRGVGRWGSNADRL